MTTTIYGPEFIRALQALLPLSGNRKFAEVHIACTATRVTVSAASPGIGGVVRIGTKYPDNPTGADTGFILTPDQVTLLAKGFPPKDLIDRDAWITIDKHNDTVAFAIEGFDLGDRIELALAPSLRSVGDLAPVVLNDYLQQAHNTDSTKHRRTLQLDPTRARVFLSTTKHISGGIDMRQADEGAPILFNVGSTLAGYMMPAGWYPDQTDEPETTNHDDHIDGQTSIYDLI